MGSLFTRSTATGYRGHVALVAPPALLLRFRAELAEKGDVDCPSCELSDDGVETWSEKETIGWGACTPLLTLETFTKIVKSSKVQNPRRIPRIKPINARLLATLVALG